MNFMTRSALKTGLPALVLALSAAAALSACAPEKPQRFVVSVDGSSTVGPISKAVAEAFNAQAPQGLSVTVAESGTGGGFAKFCTNATQVQGASRPIRTTEMEECAKNGVQYIELPVAFDALTVVVNPENPIKEITVAQLGAMWSPASEGDEQGVGKIVNWNQVDKSFPDLALKLYGPGTASGTFDYFTQVVNGEEGASRKDFFPSENDNNIVLGVEGDKGALGYFGYAYYEANKDKLRALGIKKDAASPAVYPSPEAVAAGQYTPLARPLFIYVNAEAVKQPPVRQFVDFYLANAAGLIPGVGFVPLPAEAYTAGQGRVEAGRVGTAFGGHSDIGGSIEEVLQRELSLDAKPAATTP